MNNLARVVEFITEDKEWNIPLLSSFLPWDICLKISKIFLPKKDVDDEVFWALSPDGNYSVKSGAQLLINQKIGLNPSVEYLWLWKANLSPKIKKFLWKACNDGLPTKARLEQVHVFTPQQCEFCGCSLETASHLFFQCRFTIDILHQLEADYGWPQIPSSAILGSFRANLQCCVDALGIPKTCQLAVVWWFVWFTRNKVIFSQEAFNVRQICILVHKFLAEWHVCGDNTARIQTRSDPQLLGLNSLSRRCAPWVPPPEGVFKVNFDGSKYSDGRTSFGFVIRNHAGEALLTGCNSLPSDWSITQAEAFGLWEAIKGACFCNLPRIIIEGEDLETPLGY
ncbi:uncharacterized protein LOC104884596 [Beta vulgaris subsp. vulgaris]|uniref:uncharacterized protein LOC104884596 n=1 Tax=Beta vulgaris subsp. vulgaris TaxID=3555 RepID=UPI0005402CDF|nr:uncharacterized protein LOC104884596 [Beta vulgaris subsp. vulgaris]